MATPTRLTLLARADVRLFQCVVIDQHHTKRNIAVYACGDDVFWAPTREGLFDPDRARRAPTWLREALAQPPAHTDVYDYRGRRLSSDSPESVPTLSKAPLSQTESRALGGENSIGQG